VENYYDMENMVMWLLTFGDKVEVLEPPEARNMLKSVAESMLEKYK
ncbi:MAG: WYL domain-containing protein, partial [Eubacterium sp.]|nr:WYL domain-containing protein [Eubacterium sp.]